MKVWAIPFFLQGMAFIPLKGRQQWPPMVANVVPEPDADGLDRYYEVVGTPKIMKARSLSTGAIFLYHRKLAGMKTAPKLANKQMDAIPIAAYDESSCIPRSLIIRK